VSFVARNAVEYREVSALIARNPIEQFPDKIKAIAAEHRPSRRPFFRNFAQLPEEAATSPELLGQVYLVYQAAMHATRAAVYYMPHLDSAVSSIAARGYTENDPGNGAPSRI
jgi:hypothetical protein